MDIELFKNSVDENDISAVKLLIGKGVDGSLENNWAIFQSFGKGFYDLAAYLGTLPEVRKRLLTSDCLTQEQRTHLVNFPTTISIGPFDAPKNAGPVEVLQVRRPVLAPVRQVVLPVRPTVRAKEENIEFSDEESEEYDEDDEEADSWVADDDEIEYEEGYDPNEVAEDPARETWNQGDWKQMINKMQQGRLKN